MSTVNFFQTPREMNRPVIVEAEEFFSSPMVTFPDDRTRHRSPGTFDVAEHLAKFPAPFHKPDLIVCQLDADGWPTNIANAPGKKVLLVGDTHHGDRPIEKRVKAALAEPWDLVVLEFRGSHAHWFEEAGVRNVAFIPGFTLNPRLMAPKRKRSLGITFVGQCDAKLHPRRHHVISELQRRGYPVMVCQTNQQAAARIYNESAVTLNISLNGDFNLRNLEAAAAGGTILSDGSHRGADIPSLIARLDAYLFDREAAYGEAVRVHQEYLTKGTPDRAIAAMQLHLTRRTARSATPGWGEHVWRRIATYEYLQEQHRVYVDDIPLRIRVHNAQEASDAADLPRLEVVL